MPYPPCTLRPHGASRILAAAFDPHDLEAPAISRPISLSEAAPPTWTLLDEAQRVHVLRAIAVLAGLVIPLLVIGRGAAAILVPVIGGLVALAFNWPRRFEQLKAPLQRPLVAALVVMFALWLPSVAGSLKPGFSLAIWFQVLGLVLFVACLSRILAENPKLHHWTLRVLLAMAVIGALDEFHQLHTVNRVGADPFDWLADCVGGFLGAVVIGWFYGRASDRNRSTAGRVVAQRD